MSRAGVPDPTLTKSYLGSLQYPHTTSTLCDSGDSDGWIQVGSQSATPLGLPVALQQHP